MGGQSKAAKEAQRAANTQANLDRQQRIMAEYRLAREKERAQRIFIRTIRSRFGGGFSAAKQSTDTSSTLG